MCARPIHEATGKKKKRWWLPKLCLITMIKIFDWLSNTPFLFFLLSKTNKTLDWTCALKRCSSANKHTGIFPFVLRTASPRHRPRPGKWRCAASLSRSVSVNSSLSVLATGPHSQQSSFIGSYIINEESKAPDDCDYLGRIDWSLQTGAAKRQIHNKYERGSAGKWGVMNLSGVHLHIYYLILHLQYSPVCALVSQYFRWLCLDIPQPLFYLFLMV